MEEFRLVVSVTVDILFVLTLASGLFAVLSGWYILVWRQRRLMYPDDFWIPECTRIVNRNTKKINKILSILEEKNINP